RAKKNGNGSVRLTTSRVLSAGAEQVGSVGGLNIHIEEKKKPADAAKVSLQSASHPDEEKWYQNASVLVKWKIRGKPAERLTVGFDQDPEGPAESRLKDVFAKFAASKDGIWYVHLLAVFADRTHERMDFRVQIDRTPPHSVHPMTDQTNVPAHIPNAVRFGTIDDTSGIDHYDVYLDSRYVTSTRQTWYPLINQNVGTHTIFVRAFDRANNVSQGTTSFRIIPNPAQSPLPSSISRFILPLIILATFLFLSISWFVTYRRRS
ncbi:MAG: hypothetical protein AAB879_00810, partial [Patescibacteria group bacterium]